MPYTEAIYDIEVFWDIREVTALISSILESAISGPSLERFLIEEASPWFEQDIMDRFNEEGDVKVGFWPPLSPTTERIRAAGGYGPDAPINQRTEALMDFVSQGRVFAMMPEGIATMEIPGPAPDPITANKLKVAQQGSTTNPRFPGSVTPPRPVLAADMGTMEVMLELLNSWIITHVVAGAVEAQPVPVL